MRTMPIGNTKEKMLTKFKEGDSKGIFDVWANAMQWHSFIDKCKISLWPDRHEVTLFYITPDPWKAHITLYIHYNWLNGTIESDVIPESPSGYKIFGSGLIHLSAEARQGIKPWELPGQRFLENFAGIMTKDVQGAGPVGPHGKEMSHNTNNEGTSSSREGAA